MGRRRQSVTERVYDEQGRLIREVTTHDALWTDEDLGYAKAHRRTEQGKCPTCKLPMAETTNPENEGSYEAPPPMRCHACTPLEHRKGEYAQSPPGLLFHVYLKDKRVKRG